MVPLISCVTILMEQKSGSEGPRSSKIQLLGENVPIN
jgi:hypothetical protein